MRPPPSTPREILEHTGALALLAVVGVLACGGAARLLAEAWDFFCYAPLVALGAACGFGGAHLVLRQQIVTRQAQAGARRVEWEVEELAARVAPPLPVERRVEVERVIAVHTPQAARVVPPAPEPDQSTRTLAAAPPAAGYPNAQLFDIVSRLQAGQPVSIRALTEGEAKSMTGAQWREATGQLQAAGVLVGGDRAPWQLAPELRELAPADLHQVVIARLAAPSPTDETP